MIDCTNGNIFMLLSLQQNNLFKVREEKYQSRIRVLEALASGTGEERGVWKTYLRLDWYKPFQNTPIFLILIFFQVVMDQLQQIKVCFRDKEKQFLSYLHHNLLQWTACICHSFQNYSFAIFSHTTDSCSLCSAYNFWWIRVSWQMSISFA